ncbi:MAG: hypothetical protein NTY16_01350 [Deltaproteobacteria bacterium]|nr:hypothetical protein [Deltaproteobacteria bacterium]
MTKSLNFFERFRIDPLLIIIIAIAVVGIGALFFPGSPTNLTPALIAVNLILIIFSYTQWRNTTRPVLSIALIGFDRYSEFYPGKIPEPFVLEECHNGAYIHLSNISNNIASEIDVEFSIHFQQFHLSEKRNLSYLNPHETARILLPFNKIIETYRDQFTTIENGDTTYTLPKDTLYIDLGVNITYGSIPRHSTNDSYHIRWVGLNNSSKPLNQIFSWNMRNDLPIYKRKTE